MKTVHKPWGKEEWLELNDRYCYKRIYINAGYKTSYQYHNFKRETNYIISGEAEIWLENDNGVVEKKIMKAGEFFNVTPPKKHRVIALTDIILQEVSTPEVDDVIRLEDDAKRPDGKIEGEHKTPAVLILSAGLGTRLHKLTKHVNKALVPLGEKAVITRIIEQFPKEYDIVMAVGYMSDSLKEYCQFAHPDRKFTFVDVTKYEGDGTGPGYSALQCKEYLQRPFYLTTSDCLISNCIPKLDGNWLAVSPTSYPEKYSTVFVNGTHITKMVNKSMEGGELAFTGLCSVLSYENFWNELEKNIKNGELVCAWENPSTYSNLSAKEVEWFDVGNLDDFNKTQTILNVKPLSLSKSVGEFTYRVGDRFLKFCDDTKITTNRFLRAKKLEKMIPPNCSIGKYFLCYDWVDGDTLYNLDSPIAYLDFFNYYSIFLYNALDENLSLSTPEVVDFYVEKTHKRIDLFIEKYGRKYLEEPLFINGTNRPALNGLINDTLDKLVNRKIISGISIYDGYEKFHGDLQFDNVVFNKKMNRFYYLDWRESFSGNTDMGSILYDLGKLYGGTLISYSKMKDPKNISLNETFPSIEYHLNSTESLTCFSKVLESLLDEDLKIIKLVTALIFINMAPLHDESFGKALWCKGIELLHENN